MAHRRGCQGRGPPPEGPGSTASWWGGARGRPTTPGLRFGVASSPGMRPSGSSWTLRASWPAPPPSSRTPGPRSGLRRPRRASTGWRSDSGTGQRPFPSPELPGVWTPPPCSGSFGLGGSGQCSARAAAFSSPAFCHGASWTGSTSSNPRRFWVTVECRRSPGRRTEIVGLPEIGTAGNGPETPRDSMETC